MAAVAQQAPAPAPPTEEMEKKAKAAAGVFKRPSYWMLFFGWSLAVCAGAVNSTAFRVWGGFITHVTGITTAIGMRTEDFHQGRDGFFPVGEAFALLASFVLGAFTCGLFIDKNQLHFRGKASYGLALITECLLLIFATILAPNFLGACLAAMACGLQNAMCTSHLGAVVRTTHVTGTATDIGSASGRLSMIYMRNGFQHSRLNIVEQAEVGVELKRLIVLVPMWSCFLLGCLFGAYLERGMGKAALLVPAIVTGLMGTIYFLFRQQLKQTIKSFDPQKLAEAREKLQQLSQALHTASSDGGPAGAPPGQAVSMAALGQEARGVLQSIHEAHVQAPEAGRLLPVQPAGVHPPDARPKSARGGGRRGGVPGAMGKCCLWGW